MPIYQEYAPFYDGSGQIRFALLMGQYLGELLERHPAPGRRALDMACGTGTLALSLAEQGWDVIGVDAAPAMVEIARSRAASAGGRVRFAQADMRDLFGERGGAPRGICREASFDLVTCFYDSLNYLLTEADLLACFQSAARALAPGGLLVADMNTRHFLEYDWGECEAIEQPGFVQISQSRFDPATACSTMDLTCFAGDDESGYRRFDETHIERAYPDALVAALLRRAGLRVEAAYECFTFDPPHARAQRIAWIGRAP